MEPIVAVLIVLVLVGVVIGFVAARRPREGQLEAPPRVPSDPTVRPEAPAVAPPAPPAAPVGLRGRLGKAREALATPLRAVRGRSGVDAATWDDLEEALLRADVGITTTTAVLGDLRAEVAAEKLSDPNVLVDRLRDRLAARLGHPDRSLHFASEGTNVWLFVGVNGVGKTTTIGKVAARQIAEGRSVVMAAGDTFRAAAVDQLATWAERTGAEIVRGNEGGDPASVIFDAVQRATARGTDLVLADTAGRLHNKTNLMEELRKVRRVAERATGVVSECLLVLDATTGQNGLAQARQFAEAAGLTGVVLTKFDGSAKGGIVLAVQDELGIPVKLVGVGEQVDDLIAFDPDEFVAALFD